MRLFPVVALSALVIGPALGQGVIQKCVDREGDITSAITGTASIPIAGSPPFDRPTSIAAMTAGT